MEQVVIGGIMANKIYKINGLKKDCPRCGCEQARICVYHFGATYTAECADCEFGKCTGDDEETAMARLYGNFLNI